MLKKIFSLFVAICLSIGLTGCGSGATDPVGTYVPYTGMGYLGYGIELSVDVDLNASPMTLTGTAHMTQDSPYYNAYFDVVGYYDARSMVLHLKQNGYIFYTFTLYRQADGSYAASLGGAQITVGNYTYTLYDKSSLVVYPY